MSLTLKPNQLCDIKMLFNLIYLGEHLKSECPLINFGPQNSGWKPLYKSYNCHLLSNALFYSYNLLGSSDPCSQLSKKLTNKQKFKN